MPPHCPVHPDEKGEESTMPTSKQGLSWLLALSGVWTLFGGPAPTQVRPQEPITVTVTTTVALSDTQSLPPTPATYYQGHDFTELAAKTPFPAGAFASTIQPGREQGTLQPADAGEWHLLLAKQDATHGSFVLRQGDEIKSQGSYVTQKHQLLLAGSGPIYAGQYQASYRWSFISGQLVLAAVDESCARCRVIWERVWQFDCQPKPGGPVQPTLTANRACRSVPPPPVRAAPPSAYPPEIVTPAATPAHPAARD